MRAPILTLALSPRVVACAVALWGGCADVSDDAANPGASTVAGSASSAADRDAGCAPARAWGEDFVRFDGVGRFTLNGEPFVPRGINSYPLLQLVGAARLDAVDDIFAQAVALGRPLVRTPAFLDTGMSPARLRDDRGALREEGLVALDRVLAQAAAHDVRLLLILTNNWGDFGGAPAVVKMIAPDENLPKNAFWSDPRAIALQLSYQTALARRVNSINGRLYAEDPTIFGWELANEARCERATTQALCDDTTLPSWAKRMSDGLRGAGVRQLIAWGGAGNLGEDGEDLRQIAAHGGVDVLTVHMYEKSAVASPDQSRAEAAITAGSALLRDRARVAEAAHLPLLLEEVNWLPAQDSDLDGERATVLDAWLALADGLGVATLPWMIGERGRKDYDGYLIRPDDLATNAVVRCE